MLTCDKPLPENANHLAKVLGTKQPTVYKSIDTLMADGYIRKGARYKRGSKPLLLTDKGVAAAITLGYGGYDAWLRYYTKISRTQKEVKKAKEDFINRFEAMFGEPTTRGFVLKELMRVCLKYNLFNNKGQAQLDDLPPPVQRIFANIILNKRDKLYGKASTTVRGYLDKHGTDPYVLKEVLLRKREEIDSVLQELERVIKEKKKESFTEGKHYYQA
jgi:hypothetical protein